MKEYLFLCYPKCSTCKKAQDYLDRRGISYRARDISQENPTEEELTRWTAQSGLPLKRFFNTSGQVYQKLGLKDKLGELAPGEQIKLLSTDGMLVKRPLLIGEGVVLVGFREAEWDSAL